MEENRKINMPPVPNENHVNDSHSSSTTQPSTTQPNKQVQQTNNSVNSKEIVQAIKSLEQTENKIWEADKHRRNVFWCVFVTLTVISIFLGIVIEIQMSNDTAEERAKAQEEEEQEEENEDTFSRYLYN